MSLPDNLRELRNNLGITQEQISKDLQINRATYAHYETGRREPDIATLKLLAKYFNVTTDGLLDNDVPSKQRLNTNTLADETSEDTHNLSPKSQGRCAMIGERIKLLRTKENLSQQELADQLNLSQQTISLYESNKREPDYNTLLKIADFFDVSVDYLLRRTDVKNPSNTYKVPNYDLDENTFISNLSSAYNSTPLHDKLKELIHTSKDLSPEQLDAVNNLIKVMIKPK